MSNGSLFGDFFAPDHLHKIFLWASPKIFNSLSRNGSEPRESTALDKIKYKKSLCVSETAVENQVASWFVQTVTHIISPSQEYFRVDISNKL